MAAHLVMRPGMYLALLWSAASMEARCKRKGVLFDSFLIQVHAPIQKLDCRLPKVLQTRSCIQSCNKCTSPLDSLVIVSSEDRIRSRSGSTKAHTFKLLSTCTARDRSRDVLFHTSCSWVDSHTKTCRTRRTCGRLIGHRCDKPVLPHV